jgi:two-component system nitrogen regulation sensor histidine kinase NtrY
VSDSGPGIKPEDKDKLFLPYFSTKTTGMGLGLPIVHEIITEHGGAVWVEDNHPRGSRFVVELPVARLSAAVETQA